MFGGMFGASHDFKEFDLTEKAEALRKFAEIFEEKTLNKWSENINETFTPQPGAYVMMCQSLFRNPKEDKEFQIKTEKKKLDLRLQ